MNHSSDGKYRGNSINVFGNLFLHTNICSEAEHDPNVADSSDVHFQQEPPLLC